MDDITVEDKLEAKKAFIKDLIDKDDRLADMLLDPSVSPEAFLKAKEEMIAKAEHDAILTDSDEPSVFSINENFRPSHMMTIDKQLVELQLTWTESKEGVKTKVFVDGRHAGDYFFEGTKYKTKDEVFDTVEEAIANIMQKVQKPNGIALGQSAHDILAGRTV